MKTKHILTAMALPALFAACTADDIVSENNGLQQNQRAKLSKDFVLNFNNEVESRYAVEGTTSLDFIFAEGDKIGANLIDVYESNGVDTFDPTDPATWKIVNTVAPALPFIYEGGVWKSANEDLGIGNYLFTNPFNPADKNRAAASYELPIVVQYSSENPNAHIEAYNKAVAAQITYEGQTSANADLKNIFAYPMIRINFDKNSDIKKVTKVVLARNYWTTEKDENGKDNNVVKAGTPFIYKGAFNHQDVAEMFNPKTLEKYLKDNKKATEADFWAGKQTSDFIIDEADFKDLTLAKVIETVKAYADIKTTPYFIYEMDETVVNNSIDVRLMIPSIADLSSVTNEETITMYVCTDKGNFEMELTDLSNYQFSNTTLVALKNAAMQRNTSYTLRTKASALVDSPNASMFFNNVVSTAADWNKLVEEYGDLKKYSAEYKAGKTSTANVDAAELIVNIINDKFALTSDLKMPEVAEFVIKSNVNVEGEVTLKNIKVDGGKLIVKKDAALTTDPTLDAASVEVEAGGELVFAAEYNEDEELVAYTNVATVHNHGTVTVPAGVIATFRLENAHKDAVLNVGAETRAAATDAVANLSGYNYGKINNWSVINASGFTNHAVAAKTTKEQGEEETGYVKDTETQKWNGVPTVKNNATFNAKGVVANAGKFENHSVLTSNFVGAAEFANTGTLDVKTGAETYIDNNEGGTIILAELNPAKGLVIYKARKDADFNPAADNFKYRGKIQHTLAGKTTTALDMSASPVNYLVANADVEIAKTYTWTNSSVSPAVTNIYPLNTLVVTDGVVTLAARTAGATAGTYVYPAQVNNLYVKGEVEMDGEWYSGHVGNLTVMAGGVFGVTADSWLQIALANITTEPEDTKKELEAGLVSVVGTLQFTETHKDNAVDVTVWPMGTDEKYTSADFDGKNIEINKDAEVKCAANTTPAVDNGQVVDRIVILNSNQLGDAFKATGWSTIDGNDTCTLVLTQDVDMSSTVKGTYKNGTTEYKEKTNADMVSILTGAKEVILRGGNITGLKMGSAATTIEKLTVEGEYGIDGSKNVDILKVKALNVPAGSMLKINNGYLVVDGTAVIGRGNENVTIDGGYTGMLIAYTADSEIVRWDLAKSVWAANNNNFEINYANAVLSAGSVDELKDVMEMGVSGIYLTDDVELEARLEITDLNIDLKEKILKGEILADGKVELKNGEVISSSKENHGIESKGNLTLDGMIVTSNLSAVRVRDGETSILSGYYSTNNQNANDPATVYALNVTGEAVVTVEAGIFVGPQAESTADSGCTLRVDDKATVYINGGEFISGNVGGESPKGLDNLFYIDGDAQLIITGGTFDQDPSKWVKAGYTAVKSGSTWTVEIGTGNK